MSWLYEQWLDKKRNKKNNHKMSLKRVPKATQNDQKELKWGPSDKNSRIRREGRRYRAGFPQHSSVWETKKNEKKVVRNICVLLSKLDREALRAERERCDTHDVRSLRTEKVRRKRKRRKKRLTLFAQIRRFQHVSDGMQRAPSSWGGQDFIYKE